MNQLKAIFTLIRFPNLIFIFFTQAWAYGYLVKNKLSLVDILTNQTSDQLSAQNFLLLTIATVIIAAAGYMINDYFDMSIDTINKPERVTIEKVFSRRRIIVWHILLNILALSMASYVYLSCLKWRWLLIQFISIFLLIIYSTKLKRKLLVGNLCIAALTALTVFSVASFEYHFPWTDFSSKKIMLFWLYIGFAFLITIIREIVKDLEDMKGDAAQECTTLPLVFGANVSKAVVYLLTAVLFVLIFFALYKKTNDSEILNWLWLAGIVIPLCFTQYFLWKAKTAKHYHNISTGIKIVTAFGIISMLFVR